MLEVIFFGIIQGLTEFLPISSSAHVRIFGEFSGMSEDPGAKFTAIMQIGTELAVLIFFRKDIARIVSAWFRKVIFRKELHLEEAADARIGWLIIIGSLPIAILGYLGQEAITTKFRSLWLMPVGTKKGHSTLADAWSATNAKSWYRVSLSDTTACLLTL